MGIPLQTRMRFHMNTTNCRGVTVAALLAWLLLLPPFSVTPNGKTFIDSGAPLSNWEVFSQHSADAECRKHRDDVRAQLDKAIASVVPDTNQSEKSGKPEKPGKKHKGGATAKSHEVFVTLRQRAAIARCVNSNDKRLRKPEASPTHTPTHI